MRVHETRSFLASTGRLLVAALFIVSGVGKLLAPPLPQAAIQRAGLPAPLLAYAASVLLELGGSALLVLGYQTRVVSAVFILYALVTAVAFHHDFHDSAQRISFLKNISIAGGLLQLVAFGGGSFSLDALRTQSRNPRGQASFPSG